MISTRKYRSILKPLLIAVFVVSLLLHSSSWRKPDNVDPRQIQYRYPLAWKHIQLSAGLGGAWYIPPEWLPKHYPPPANLVEAAWLAAEVTNKHPKHYLENTAIPRIVHQTWKSADVAHFPDKALDGVEKWLGYATAANSSMAYFLWDDSGVRELLRSSDVDYFTAIKNIAPGSKELADILPRPVEVADVFRVVVCNTIGGVYADVDTVPLRSPTSWIDESDISNWTDPSTGVEYGSHGSTNQSFPAEVHPKPVSLILGIEADTPEGTSAHWRMGYEYPVQLTQWALAGRPNQPVLDRFLEDFEAKVVQAFKKSQGDNSSAATLAKFDPLELTGPVAITVSTKEYLEEKAGIRWQSLSGLEDGGRSKVVLDTLILPITGFSPGRGRYGNMGSRPLTHADARLQHIAQGSWKKFRFRVEVGKFCRTVFGMCRDWPKV